MISSQRLIMIFILINIVAGIGVSIYAQPNTYDETQTLEHITINEQYESEFKEDNTKYGGTSVEDDAGEGKTVGNVMKMGSMLWDITINSLNPFSVNRTMFTTSLERIIADILVLFRILGTILMSIELYLLFKNRKAT